MAAREYLNFDLELGPRGEGYVARVRASPVGEASGTFSLPFTPEGLENVVLRLGRSRTTVRRVGSRQDEMVKGFGSSLYEAVFAGEVGTSLRRSIDEAARQSKGLRVRLHLEDAPELGDVPWELLYVPGLSRHLVLSSTTPLVRYLGLPGTPRPLRVDGPIRVLLVVAAPSDVVRLDAENEVALIEAATADLRQAGVIALDSMAGASLRELQRRLRRDEYHVLHFIGHGGFDEAAGEGVLAFEDEARRSHLVRTSHLGTILADHNTLRLAVLNACEGARSSVTDPFAGVAPGLIRQGIPAVIAMQFEVTDAAAAIFGHEFYLALADGCPVDQAAAEARKAMYASDCDVEWATPVLYLRASDGRIFDTPSINRSGLDRPAFLGAAPVSTGDLARPGTRPAATEPEPVERSPAAHGSPPAPPRPTVPVAATAQPSVPAPSASSGRDPPPVAPAKAAPGPEDEEDLSPWALPFPIHVDEPAPETRAARRARSAVSGRADATRTSGSREDSRRERNRGDTLGEWTDAGGAWEGTASGDAWPPATGKPTADDPSPGGSSRGGGGWLLVLLLVATAALVWWMVVDGRSDGGEPETETDRETETDTETDRDDETEPGGGTDTGNGGQTQNGDGAGTEGLEELVSQCRGGDADACDQLLAREDAGPDEQQVALDHYGVACSADDLDACARVLSVAAPDSAAWDQAFQDVLDCRTGGFDACGEVARQHDDDRLDLAVDDWLALCQGWDREACQRVLGFAEPDSPAWLEAEEVRSSIPED
jgi:hypothetical protein